MSVLRCVAWLEVMNKICVCSCRILMHVAHPDLSIMESKAYTRGACSKNHVRMCNSLHIFQPAEGCVGWDVIPTPFG